MARIMARPVDLDDEVAIRLRRARTHARLARVAGEVEGSGITEYSIFRRGQDLVLSLRVDDFETAWNALDRDPVNLRWQEFMGRLFKPAPDKSRTNAWR